MTIRLNQFNAHTSGNRQAGFTLVEMMVVIVILTVFAAMIGLSVGSSDTQKNRAFYEHFISTLKHLRLVSAERMQPMGIAMVADVNGQTKPKVMALANPYAALISQNNTSQGRSVMELSAMRTEPTAQMPSWQAVTDISLPTVPKDVEIVFAPLQSNGSGTTPNGALGALQPWFSGSDVPSVLWYGTGEAMPVRIEIRYQGRLVGDGIIISADGQIQQGDNNVES